MEEKWKPIPGFTDLYQVSDQGRIWSCRNEKLRKITQFAKDGYWFVQLHNSGKRSLFTVHRLVMLAFEGECPDGYEVNHIDGDKTNCALSNLEYCTVSDNKKHAYRTGLASWRPPHPGFGKENKRYNAKIDEKAVTYIHQLRSKGLKHREIAEQLNLSQAAVSLILSGKRWPHLHPGNSYARANQKLTNQQVRRVRYLASSGEKLTEIAKQFNVTASYVWELVNGRRRRNV